MGFNYLIDNMFFDLLLKLVSLAAAISYLLFIMLLAKKDGVIDALTFYSLPARTLSYLMGEKFWGELDVHVTYQKIETKLVGEPILPHNNYPPEVTHTLWGLFKTPEGRRERNLAIIRPLWPFASMAMFMGMIWAVCEIIYSFH